MNYIKLLLSPEGRISRADFWRGAPFAFGLQFGIGRIDDVVGPIFALVFIWCWICLYAKRLHDLGLSGWAQLPAHLLSIFMAITALYPLTTGPSEIDNISDDVIGPLFWLMVVGLLVSLGYVLWLGMAKGQAAENRYGAPVARTDST